VLGVRIGQTNGVAGVVVQSVEPVSTAAALGLSVGDVVYRVNGRNMQKPEDLVGLISELEVGAEVAIAYRRDGKKRRALGYLIPAGVLGGMMPPAGEMPLRIELKAPREF
jgi:S1-C subfamily serine protease